MESTLSEKTYAKKLVRGLEELQVETPECKHTE